MSKYLYGASVQGIQGFIFQTNKLKEIAGASQLVDNINEKEFKEFCKKEAGHTVIEDNLILNAAGNIKYVIEDEEALKKIVLKFPKYITNYAPGITINQAVVEVKDGLQKATNKLEKKLRTQLNKVQKPVDIGFMGLERARRTGGVGYFEVKDKKTKKIEDVLDRGTYQKTKLRDTIDIFEKISGYGLKKEDVPFNIEDITQKGENSSWIAVIHADGNGLGLIIQDLVKNLNTDDDIKKGYREFSGTLKKATEEAAQKAFNKVIPENWQKSIQESNERYPIRPVVLGGDDLTVIIRADLAFDFTVEFLKAFEETTKKHFENIETGKIENLTACAGIAYIKDNYPFHYGVELAEALTKEAKKVSKSDKIKKELPPSSIAFYKVQSSFTESLDEMIKRTHFVNGKNKFFAGPYFIKETEGVRYYKELTGKMSILEEEASKKTKGVSKLRQWVSELHNDKAKANFMMDRIKEINPEFYKKLDFENERKKEPKIIMDLIELHTFKYEYDGKNN